MTSLFSLHICKCRDSSLLLSAIHSSNRWSARFLYGASCFKDNPVNFSSNPVILCVNPVNLKANLVKIDAHPVKQQFSKLY